MSVVEPHTGEERGDVHTDHPPASLSPAAFKSMHIRRTVLCALACVQTQVCLLYFCVTASVVPGQLMRGIPGFSGGAFILGGILSLPSRQTLGGLLACVGMLLSLTQSIIVLMVSLFSVEGPDLATVALYGMLPMAVAMLALVELCLDVFGRSHRVSLHSPGICTNDALDECQSEGLDGLQGVEGEEESDNPKPGRPHCSPSTRSPLSLRAVVLMLACALNTCTLTSIPMALSTGIGGDTKVQSVWTGSGLGSVLGLVHFKEAASDSPMHLVPMFLSGAASLAVCWGIDIMVWSGDVTPKPEGHPSPSARLRRVDNYGSDQREKGEGGERDDEKSDRVKKRERQRKKQRARQRAREARECKTPGGIVIVKLRNIYAFACAWYLLCFYVFSRLMQGASSSGASPLLASDRSLAWHAIRFINEIVMATSAWVCQACVRLLTFRLLDPYSYRAALLLSVCCAGASQVALQLCSTELSISLTYLLLGTNMFVCLSLVLCVGGVYLLRVSDIEGPESQAQTRKGPCALGLMPPSVPRERETERERGGRDRDKGAHRHPSRPRQREGLGKGVSVAEHIDHVVASVLKLDLPQWHRYTQTQQSPVVSSKHIAHKGPTSSPTLGSDPAPNAVIPHPFIGRYPCVYVCLLLCGGTLSGIAVRQALNFAGASIATVPLSLGLAYLTPFLAFLPLGPGSPLLRRLSIGLSVLTPCIYLASHISQSGLALLLQWLSLPSLSTIPAVMLMEVAPRQHACMVFVYASILASWSSLVQSMMVAADTGLVLVLLGVVCSGVGVAGLYGHHVMRTWGRVCGWVRGGRSGDTPLL
ncbi:hypothetical protein KIPB_006343 [Kipferlia bialata]|uniref:Uncharacterized protein n=1 Tax=Kipferlia bialata TaxID=797122 RepID=A0A9K3CT17_9EUKA|nr:hypothetical protein KIPB_003917 [Kipferlia bialata]GIQ84783.1 hypothetical protein KIPB_006343 [Kipferlia bialata]|eukprot:g3917.t1